MNKRRLKLAKIVFEDEWILVVDKAPGIVVNRSGSTAEKTLQDELSDYFSLEGLGIGGRAGIVHRLDRETSGLMVVAKTQKAFDFLQDQFRQREVSKKYIALVHGHVRAEKGTVEGRIGRIGSFGKFGVVAGNGREAVTDFSVDSRYTIKGQVFDRLSEDDNKNRKRYLKSHGQDYSLLSVFPRSGRTHQIRVHLKSIGLPVVSDLIYGPSKLLKFDLLWCNRLFLHAEKVSFSHPANKKRVEFKSDLPKDLKDAILNLVKVKDIK